MFVAQYISLDIVVKWIIAGCFLIPDLWRPQDCMAVDGCFFYKKTYQQTTTSKREKSPNYKNYIRQL